MCDGKILYQESWVLSRLRFKIYAKLWENVLYRRSWVSSRLRFRIYTELTRLLTGHLCMKAVCYSIVKIPRLGVLNLTKLGTYEVGPKACDDQSILRPLSRVLPYPYFFHYINLVEINNILALPMLRVLLSKAQECKDLWKPTLSCWYSLHSSRWALLDEYPCPIVLVIFQLFCIIL